MQIIKSIKKFPQVFWTANLSMLFERGAYYAMASFLVLYLKRIGMGGYWASTLNSLLWFFIYFLPIISGSLADHFGYKKALTLAFVLLTTGYLTIGTPVWMGLTSLEAENQAAAQIEKRAVKNAPPASVQLQQKKSKSKPDKSQISNRASLPRTASILVFAMLVFAFAVIGIGGSIIKPCISGSVQKFSPPKLAALGFGVYYLIVNLGSLTGRTVSYFIRVNTNLSFIFAVSGVLSIIALLSVIFKYEEPENNNIEHKSMKEVFLNMFAVLKQLPFVFFLLIMTGFAFIYHQVYNIIPLYLEHFVEDNPPVELYTMANPMVVVLFQLIVTKLFGKMRPVRSIVVGLLILSGAMLINIIPLLTHTDIKTAVIGTLPLGGLYAILTVALIAFGELFQAARRFEFIGKLAPKGQEGLYMGYGSLPMALGSLIGGPVGAYIFYDIMVKNDNQILGWTILAGIGLFSALATFIFALWVEKKSVAA
ncbi:MAG: MFS transporter [Deltaproteobacteria bacterium]|jgi:POT family proton-dependent oligopeptide transporter|nr:MFS transporter [Deltaproteobacteria bacterium]